VNFSELIFAVKQLFVYLELNFVERAKKRRNK